MTREEAIEILKKISLFGTHKNVQEKQRAICLAISALEQQPCEDAVSRKDVINAIDKWISEYKPQHYLIQSVRELPSVTQKSKTGHWIDSSNGWMCSKCNRDNTFDTNYCPNCGADMGGAENAL